MSTRTRARMTATSLFAAAAMISVVGLAGCSSEDKPDGPYRDAGANEANAEDGRSDSSDGDTAIEGLPTHHEFRVVERIALDEAVDIRGLEVSADGTLVANVPPADGVTDSKVLRIDPSDGAKVTDLAVNPVAPQYMTYGQDFRISGVDNDEFMALLPHAWGVTQTIGGTPDTDSAKRSDNILTIQGPTWVGHLQPGSKELEVAQKRRTDVGICALPGSNITGDASGKPQETTVSATGGIILTDGLNLSMASTPAEDKQVSPGSGQLVQIVADGDKIGKQDLLSEAVENDHPVSDQAKDSRGILKEDIEDDFEPGDRLTMSGLTELDCLGYSQMQAWKDKGVSGDHHDGDNGVVAIVNSELMDHFTDHALEEGYAGGTSGLSLLAEFAGPAVNAVLIDPTTYLVTATFGVTGGDLDSDATLTSIAVDPDDATTAWVTVEGEKALYKVNLA